MADDRAATDSRAGPLELRVGIDLVSVRQIAESLAAFGDRFLRRIFTEDEIAYATSEPSQTAERLAARFAAKEATIKALDLGRVGLGWRDIEVRRTASGRCELALHGTVAAAAEAAGADRFALSMSHEGEHATAIVITHTRPKGPIS